MSTHNFTTSDCNTDSSNFEHLEGMSHISGKKKIKTKIIDEFTIKPFSNEFCDNPAIIMIGKNQGNLQHIEIMHHLFESKKVDEFIVISPADKHLKLYTFIDKVYDEYKSEIVEKLLKKQSEDKKNSNAKHIMIVFDDCALSKNSCMKDSSLMELLFNARHYNISYILKMQIALGITQELRNNFDYVYLFYEDFISNIKRLYDHYTGIFPAFDTFREVFKEVTCNNDTLLIVNNGSSIQEKVFYSKCVKNKKYNMLPSVNLKYKNLSTDNKEDKEDKEDKKESGGKKDQESTENAILNIIAKSNCEIVKHMSSCNLTDNLSNELLLKIALCNDSIVKILTK